MLRAQIARLQDSSDEEEAMRFKVDEEATTTWAPPQDYAGANVASFQSFSPDAVLPDGTRLTATAAADLELALETTAIDADTEFSRHAGVFPPGHVLLRKTLSLDKAQRWCANLPGCQGFGFEGHEQSGVLRVIFKGGQDPIEKSEWTHFMKEAGGKGEEAAFAVRPGMLSDGADLHAEVMPLRKAASWCTQNALCAGFTFAGKSPEAAEAVWVYFKGSGAVAVAPDDSTAYRLDVLGLANMRCRATALNLMPSEDVDDEHEQANSNLTTHTRQSVKNAAHLIGSPATDVLASAAEMPKLTSSGAANLEKIAATMTKDVSPLEMDALAQSIAAAKVDLLFESSTAAATAAGQSSGAEPAGEAEAKPANKALAALDVSSVEKAAGADASHAGGAASGEERLLAKVGKVIKVEMPSAADAGHDTKLLGVEPEDGGAEAAAELEAALGGGQSSVAGYPPTAKEAVDAAARLPDSSETVSAPQAGKVITAGQTTDKLARLMDRELAGWLDATAASAAEELRQLDVQAQAAPVATAVLAQPAQQTLRGLEADLSSLEASENDAQSAFEESQRQFMTLVKSVPANAKGVDPRVFAGMDRDLTQLEADSAAVEQTIDEQKAAIANMANARDQVAAGHSAAGRGRSALGGRQLELDAAAARHRADDEEVVVVNMADVNAQMGSNAVAADGKKAVDVNRANVTAKGASPSVEAVTVSVASHTARGADPSTDQAATTAAVSKPVATAAPAATPALERVESDAANAPRTAGSDEGVVVTLMANDSEAGGTRIVAGAETASDLDRELALLEADTAAAEKSAADEKMFMAGMASARAQEGVDALAGQLAAEMAALEANVADAESGLILPDLAAPAAARSAPTGPAVQPAPRSAEAAPAARTLGEMAKALSDLDGSATSVESELAESEDALTQMMQEAISSGSSVSLAAIHSLDAELAHLEDDSEEVDGQIEEQKALIDSLAKSGTPAAEAQAVPVPALGDMVRKPAEQQ